MKPFRVVITDRFDAEAFAQLKSDPRLSVSVSAEPSPVAEELAKADGLVIRSRTRITDSLLAQAPDLKVIVTSTSGFDHIDLQACGKRNVAVMYTPDANAASATELTWGLVLAVSRKIPASERAVKAGDWNRERLLGRQLDGRTYGVIGLGRIGSRVARIARAFGMQVVAFDPYKDESHFQAEKAERLSLEEVFKVADIVSCHVPSTPETFHMIRRLTLEEANRDAIFVNTSRGAVIEEHILCEALDNGWINGAGLDVFEKEPLPRDSRLQGRANVVLTPHIGATTAEAFRASSMEAVQKVRAFASHREIRDGLPGNEPWLQGGFIRRD